MPSCGRHCPPLLGHHRCCCLRLGRVCVRATQVSDVGMPASVIQAAAQLSGGRARPALDYLQYDAAVAPAIKYAFGNVFICEVGGDGTR